MGNWSYATDGCPRHGRYTSPDESLGARLACVCGLIADPFANAAALAEVTAERDELRERAEKAGRAGKAFVRYCLDRAFQKVRQENGNRGPHEDRRWWREVRAAALEAAKGKTAIRALKGESDG